MYEPTAAAFGDLVERLDHVSVAVRSIRAPLPSVSLVDGVFHDGGDHPPGGVRRAHFLIPGSGKLELIEPLDSADGDNFLSRFLAANGEGIHHITLEVTDIQHAIAGAEELGLDVVGVNLDDADWKEAFVHPKSASGVLVQIAAWTDRAPSGRGLEDVIGDRSK